ncbi:MAG: hypothetical protein ACP5O5_00345 [Fervidicoccaceae archaeon]
MSKYQKKGIRILRYPFLIVDVLSYLNDRGYLPGIKNLAEAVSLLGAGSRIKEIVEESIKYGYYKLEDEESKLPSEAVAFHSALLIMGRIGGKWLVNRLSVSVSKSVKEELPFFEEENLVLLSRMLGVQADYHSSTDQIHIKIKKVDGSVIIEQRNPFSLSIYEYLRATKRLAGDPLWKLTNQLVLNGKVYLERRRFERIIEELIMNKIASLYEEYAELSKLQSLPSPLNEIENMLKQELDKILVKKGVSELGFGEMKKVPIKTEAFPPCIKKIYERALSSENLSHSERFALATFLIALGADEDFLMEVLKHSPDFNERIAKYQVQHLMGKKGSGTKYRPYNCAKMKTLSLCIAECGTKTPLQKYYLNIKELGKKNEDKGSIV